MRKQLLKDFTRVYHLHLEGDVRRNPSQSGTQYNVFGIQVGVGITIAIRSDRHIGRELRFHRIDKHLRRQAKLEWLKQQVSMAGVKWERVLPDAAGNWINPLTADDRVDSMAMGSKAGRAGTAGHAPVVFREYSLGIATHRDRIVYGFDRDELVERVSAFVEAYNADVDRFQRTGSRTDPAAFAWSSAVVWDRDLKQDAARGHYAEFVGHKVRRATYRPYASRWLYFDRILNAEVYSMTKQFPTELSEQENRAIVVSDIGCRSALPSALCCAGLTDLHAASSLDGHQSFPFYVYDEDGGKRRENITDAALARFRERYGSKRISKWDIFNYVYGLLHHPAYRARFANRLRRELPPVTFAADFEAFATAGKELADLHLNYEHLGPYPLKYVETLGVPLSYEISEKMNLSKDKMSLRVNSSLTLAGIPPEVFDYRLGNRSALEWVIDQYQVTTDKRTGVESDPNRYDDPRYIVNLVGQVVKVSVETVKIVNALPAEFGGDEL